METTTQDEALIDKKPVRPKETLPESIAGIASVFVVGLFIIGFVLQHFEIPSGSMENTLLIGDHVFVDRLTPTGKSGPLSWLVPYRELHRGDIAVFLSPVQPDLYLVKRIIGVPGDRIHLRNGWVYRNGIRQAEPYVVRNGTEDDYRDNFPSTTAFAFGQTSPRWPSVMRENMQGDDVVVPAGHYFAMGDNRDVSLDSRYWGFVPRENIIGGPLLIAWSFNIPGEEINPDRPITERIGSFLHTTLHFFTLTRWNRVVRLVH